MEDMFSHNGTLAGSHNGVHLPSSLPARSIGRQVRGIAIVGLGYWGPNWVRNFSQTKGIERVVCCDFSRPRLEHIKGRYPSVVVTEQLDHVLEDPNVDAVVVATPVNTHFEIASRCLKAGKSTLVEKPLSTSCEQAEQLIKMARERDLTLMAGHTFEYSAPVMKIRQLIDSGELGDIFYISSVRANLGLLRSDVNVAWDLATHDISIILMLLGQMPLEVTCQGESHLSRSHRGCRAAYAALRRQRDRVRARQLARPEQDSADDDRGFAQDAGVRRHRAAGKSPGLRQGRHQASLLRHLRRFSTFIPLRRYEYPAHRRPRAAQSGMRSLRRLRQARGLPEQRRSQRIAGRKSAGGGRPLAQKSRTANRSHTNPEDLTETARGSRCTFANYQPMYALRPT